MQIDAAAVAELLPMDLVVKDGAWGCTPWSFPCWVFQVVVVFCAVLLLFNCFAVLVLGAAVGDTVACDCFGGVVCSAVSALACPALLAVAGDGCYPVADSHALLSTLRMLWPVVPTDDCMLFTSPSSFHHHLIIISSSYQHHISINC